MLLRILPILILFSACSPAKHSTAVPAADSGASLYDSTLAAKWGANPNGMKSYVIVFLKKGPNRSSDSTTRAQLQAAHMANIGKLADAGKLIMAGPMMDDGEIRGIYLFDVRTLDEAKALTETDPAIQAGSLIMEMHPWFSSAALMEIPQLHKKGIKKG